MAGILIQAPFITKKWMYIIKNGQRPRGLEQEGLKGQKFFFSFLHELGYSDSFGKISFFGLFWPCGLYEGHKAKNFHCFQNNFLFSIQ